jgi:hypothetical protein
MADQLRRAAQGDVGPGIGREPVPMPWLPVGVVGDVSVDKSQNFPAALDPQHPWGALEPVCFQMPQTLMHRWRPRTHRPYQLVAAAHDPAGHAPARKWHVDRSRVLMICHQAKYY